MGKAENFVESYLKQQAEKNGFLCYKMTSPGLRGVPDRILIGNGYTVFVECKSDKGHLSEIQKFRISEMRARGAHITIAASRKDVDDLIEILKNC